MGTGNSKHSVLFLPSFQEMKTGDSVDHKFGSNILNPTGENWLRKKLPKSLNICKVLLKL